MAIGCGMMFVFFRSGIVLNPTNLGQYCLALGCMSLGDILDEDPTSSFVNWGFHR
jgi:hypothetical protein